MLSIVRLGTPRLPGEGLRIGTVRRPPRGVAKSRFAADDWYDVWYPELSPTQDLVREALDATNPAQWQAFARKYRAQMARPEAARTIGLLAALSHHADFSVGCYCEDESRCHRSILREIFAEHGARFRPG